MIGSESARARLLKQVHTRVARAGLLEMGSEEVGRGLHRARVCAQGHEAFKNIFHAELEICN